MYRPIIPWMGGKRRLAKHILPQLPVHRCYVEPFAGGAAILFLKEPSKVEVLNDINGELVNLYRVVKHHLEEFLRQFKHALVSRQIFEWQKMTNPETLTDIQRAARFYYLQKLAFGAKSHGQHFGTAATAPPRLNLLRIEEDLSMAHLRLARVYIEHLPWDQCIDRYDRPTTLFYLDPPYWGTAGYGQDFGLKQYRALADRMRRMKGKALLSINAHPTMQEVFSDFPSETLHLRYTVGGTTRAKETSEELLIRNYRLSQNDR